MLKIGIYQRDCEVYDRVISAALAECNVPAEVRCAESLDPPLDICVLTGSEVESHHPANIVVAPATCDASCVAKYSPRSIVSFGLCCKNTITVSSLLENILIISIQRELVTLTNKHVDEQEFSVSISDPEEPELILAAVAILLLADVPIDKICTIAF